MLSAGCTFFLNLRRMQNSGQYLFPFSSLLSLIPTLLIAVTRVKPFHQTGMILAHSSVWFPSNLRLVLATVATNITEKFVLSQRLMASSVWFPSNLRLVLATVATNITEKFVLSQRLMAERLATLLYSRKYTNGTESSCWCSSSVRTGMLAAKYLKHGNSLSKHKLRKGSQNYGGQRSE